MVTFEFLNLPADIDEERLKRELQKQIGALPDLYSIKILRERNGTSKGMALMLVEDSDCSDFEKIENAEIKISNKQIGIIRRSGPAKKTIVGINGNNRDSYLPRRNTYRERRNSRVYDDNVYEVDRYGSEFYDDRRRDPSYGIPNRSMIYPANFNNGVRDKVVKRYGKVCHICGEEIKPESDITLDHIPPLAERFNEFEWKFPQWKRNECFNDINFLKPAHRCCNSRTGSGGVSYDKESVSAAMSDKHFSVGVAGWDKILPKYNEWMISKF